MSASGHGTRFAGWVPQQQQQQQQQQLAPKTKVGEAVAVDGAQCGTAAASSPRRAFGSKAPFRRILLLLFYLRRKGANALVLSLLLLWLLLFAPAVGVSVAVIVVVVQFVAQV